MKDNKEFQELCTILYLKEEQKKCEPYDGFSGEDQLEFYINQNGFNPIKEYNTLIEFFKNKYILDEIKIDFFNIKESWNTEKGKIFLENLENGYLKENNNRKLILSILIECYFDLRRK